MQAPVTRGCADREPGLIAAPNPMTMNQTSRAERYGTEPPLQLKSVATDIAIEHWDLLFRAALERLAHVAQEQEVLNGSSALVHTPTTALRECLDASGQLRRSVPCRTGPDHAQTGVSEA